jgi:rhamnosyltransferase
MVPRVTICLPTWNGERHLERLMPRLAEQEIEGGLEIVAIDSGSTDRTRELLMRAGARVETIDARAFRHGETRNQLARMARGEVCVFLSQDALPRDCTTVAALVAALNDPRTAGAGARVLPHPEDDALTARSVLDAPESGVEARVYEVGAGDPSGVGARGAARNPARPAALGADGDAASHVPFNNVASAIRASVLREIPFPDVAFGEDSAWASRAITAGYRIRFVPEAVVHHAHRYTMGTAFRRYRTDAEFHVREHGRSLRPSLWSVMRGVAHELRADWRFVRGEGRPLSELARAPALRAAQVWGQYVGSRQARS